MLSASLKKHFAAAVRRLMRPVVRQAIAYGVSFGAFSRLLKQLYVDVAENEFALPFKRQTDSRLALLTGISRKEVSQLRHRRGDRVETPDVEDSVATHAIGRWMAGPPFATPDGIARRLRYESDESRQPSFADLVKSLGIDIPVRAVLDELIRLGSVTLRPDGDVELRREAHIPAVGMEGKLALLGSDPAELFTTIAHNIDREDSPWLQRKIVYDNIGSDGLAALREESQRAGEEFVRRANALVSSYDRDRNPDAPGGERSRVAVGVYYFEESATAGDEAEEVDTPTAPPGRIRKKK